MIILFHQTCDSDFKKCCLRDGLCDLIMIVKIKLSNKIGRGRRGGMECKDFPRFPIIFEV